MDVDEDCGLQVPLQKFNRKSVEEKSTGDIIGFKCVGFHTY
jgi:hypothetical protein